MCGRYVLKATRQELEHKYKADAEKIGSLEPSYNVAPSMHMPVVREEGEKRLIAPFRWGLIPFWADSMNTGYSMINARAESLAPKKSFSKPFRSQRCVVPASGFYEWKKTGDGKIPHYITLKSSPVMSFAGLYEEWELAGKDKEIVKSFTIITTDANKPMKELHDRMPAMLLDEEIELWLDPQNNDTDALQDLLRPWPDDDIDFWCVGQEVNNVRNSGAHLIEPFRDLFS